MFRRSPPWQSVVYWALDLETGGLDARRDPILAVGMVPVREGAIRLAEAFQTLVRAEGGTVDPESIPAHQILPSDVGGGRKLAEVLDEVDRRIREGALLVHHRGLDVAFLRREYARAGRKWPRPPVVDTMDLLRRLARARSPTASGETVALNLRAARREWGLPDYAAHDALTDAVAAAELFLVLRHATAAKTLRELS